METALQFGMKDPSRIASWKKAYREGGVDLSKPKGRLAMSDASKGRKNKQTEQKEMSYEQKLERENELLRLEVEYLKKLRAFQTNPEGYLESTTGLSLFQLKEEFKLIDVLHIVGIPELPTIII